MAGVLVVGSSGNLGRAVTTAALAAGLDPIATVRSETTEPGERHLDFGAPATFAPAVAGCDAVFLMRPPAISRVGPTLNRFVDVAAAEGVGHIVFASVAGAAENPIVPHHRVEKHLGSAAIPSTILRPGFFAQNIESAYRADIVNEDRIVLPAGDGQPAFIDALDIGEVAAVALADPHAHAGKAYTLTGATAHSFDEVASKLSGLLDRTVRYEPVSPIGYVRRLRSQGMGWSQALVQTVLHTELRRADDERITDDVARLLGRPPTSLDDYLERNREVWLR
ncbi:MAG: NmrA family NAD(P)-binding protein [Acidimicrobiales bacterium]